MAYLIEELPTVETSLCLRCGHSARIDLLHFCTPPARELKFCPDCEEFARPKHFCISRAELNSPKPVPVSVVPAPVEYRWSLTERILDALNDRLPPDPTKRHRRMGHRDSRDWCELDDWDHTNELEYRLPLPHPSMDDNAYWDNFWFTTIKDFLMENAPLEAYQVDAWGRIQGAYLTVNCPCDQCKGSFTHFRFRLQVAKLADADAPTWEETEAADDELYERAADWIGENHDELEAN